MKLTEKETKSGLITGFIFANVAKFLQFKYKVIHFGDFAPKWLFDLLTFIFCWAVGFGIYLLISIKRR